MKNKKVVERKKLSVRLRESLEELRDALETGRPLEEFFTVRTVEIPDPPAFDTKRVRALRKRMGVSQAVFASLLGVSPQLVEHWEQGVRVPQPIACRLLDEVSRDPKGFVQRHMKHVKRVA
jgi:putative transcriptional regulator